ncbi:MAG: ROK family protein [Clostridiales Family XIII bacterium]|nr:ROK family protein [Clostridiales Family XIII bacterium]
MNYNIGIDLGGTNIVAGLVDESGRILAKSALPTRATRPSAEVIEDIVSLARSVADESGISPRDVNSVGVGVPGITNKSTGIIEYACNLNWTDVPLRSALREALDCPVFLENDANAAAFGEYAAGVGKNCDIFVMITLGTGIGGGVILNGTIFEGFNFAGTEVGHMVIEKGGRPCTCGRHGCFERYASATGLILTTKEYMRNDPSSLLWELAKGDLKNVDGRIPFDAMKRGDPTAKAVIDTYIEDLACGATNLINIFQPSVLAVGGGIAGQGESLLAPMRNIVEKEAHSRNSPRNAKIVAAELGNDAGIIGAANLFMEARRA